MATTPISPKVRSGFNFGIAATLAVGLLTAVTPDMLDFLGDYAGAAGVLLGVIITALRGYNKPDPLRDAATGILHAQAAGAVAGPPVVEPEEDVLDGGADTVA